MTFSNSDDDESDQDDDDLTFQCINHAMHTLHDGYQWFDYLNHEQFVNDYDDNDGDNL